MSKLAHLGEILITLQYKKIVTASELSEVLEVDKKTIYRYIESMIEANIPIQTRKGRNGGYYLDSHYLMKEPALSVEELEALMLASELLTKKNGFAFEHQLRCAVTKVLNVSNKGNTRVFSFNSDDELFKSAIGGLSNFDDVFSKICCAIENGRAVGFSYTTEGKESMKAITVDPYNIIFKEGRWHLIGLEHEQNKVAAYSLTHIDDMDISRYVYIRPLNFSLEEYIKKCWGVFGGEKKRLAIKFSSRVRDFIVRGKWHPLQELEQLEDGGVIIRFSIDTFDEIKGWILGFGASAEVLEPEELKSEIMEEINQCIKIYNI